MPKEICQFADTTREDATSIEVVWGKESSSVQLHFQRHIWNTLDASGLVGSIGSIQGLISSLAAAGLQPDKAPPPVENVGTPAKVGVDEFSDNLDRVAINRLIRALRRARDAAYGADA